MEKILPRDIVSNILRQVSSRPRNEFWPAYIRPVDALSILECDGPLAEILKIAITSIASDGVKHSKETLVVHGDGPVGLQTLSDLVSKLSKTLQTLSLNGCMFLHRDLLGNFQKCANLSALYFSDMYEYLDNPIDAAVLLEACPSKLRILVLEGKCFTGRIAVAIAENCTGLSNLTLRYQSTDCSLSPIWPIVGPTLTHLTMSVPEAEPRYPHLDIEIQHSCRRISTHCVRLKSLSLESLSNARFPPGAIQLLGRRLEDLRMVSRDAAIPLEDLKKVIVACPNTAIHLYDEGGPSARTLRCLGESIHLLKWKIGPTSVQGLESAALAATALREVHLQVQEGSRWDFVSWINRLPCAKALHVVYSNRMHLEEDCLEIRALSQEQNRLEKFSCTTSGTISPAFFHEFAAASPHQRRVQVEFTDSITYRLEDWTAEEARRSAAGFIRSFSQCRRLEELVIVDDFLTERSEMIADACRSLPLKNADVFIGGVQYTR